MDTGRFAWMVLAMTALVPGCAEAPTYEKVGTPTASADASATPSGAPAADGEGPTLLVDDETPHVRIVLEKHLVSGEEVSLFLHVTNKDEAATKRMKYVHLAVEGREDTLYFAFPEAVAPREARRFELDATDGGGLARRPWVNLTFYYSDDTGGAFTDDEAVVMDLRTRGLPGNVS